MTTATKIPATRSTDLACLFGIMHGSIKAEIPLIQLSALALIANNPGITRGGISDELGADRGADVARDLINRRLVVTVEPSERFRRKGAGKAPEGLAAAQAGVDLIRSILSEGVERARGINQNK